MKTFSLKFTTKAYLQNCIRDLQDLFRFHKKLDWYRDELPQIHCGNNWEGTLFS